MNTSDLYEVYGSAGYGLRERWQAAARATADAALRHMKAAAVAQVAASEYADASSEEAKTLLAYQSDLNARASSLKAQRDPAFDAPPFPIVPPAAVPTPDQQADGKPF